ncbi:hypothetical protein Pfo_025158 [Paulownia fortunei]|nr:hypothetical protein Pfo_025158 [Paulownia fortunei]
MALSFSVTHKKPELVAPAEPTPREIKAISDLGNQESLRSHYPMIMFYKNNPSMKGKEPVKVLREALAKTLVYYHPYAGRLVEGPDKKFKVDCTAEGVAFVEADARVTLEQLGFVLAIRFNHVMSDALGSLQFETAVSEMAKGASTPSMLPVWKRDLLTARHPPRLTHTHPEYKVYIESTQNLVRRSFTFGPQEIKANRKNLPKEIHSSSKFDLISACLWRSRTRALQFNPEDNVRITCMVNGRRKNCLDLPLGYYANAILSPAKPIRYAIKLVKEARTQATEEYARSTIDFLANKGRPEITNPGDIIVSDASKVGFDEVDFGQEKPIHGGTMNKKWEDVMVAPICLPVAVMEKFENELRRLIWGPVENSNTSNPIMFQSKL